MDGISTCKCLSGFIGPTCNIPTRPVPCDPNPCMNNGTCTITGPTQFECSCLPNFSGNKCQNCDIKNCQTCSVIDDVCTTCTGGFVPANATTGGCGKH